MLKDDKAETSWLSGGFVHHDLHGKSGKSQEMTGWWLTYPSETFMNIWLFIWFIIGQYMVNIWLIYG
jgi:hypothetical protein